MDKLAPLVRHRFWLLFALSLPLALTGYFLASGDMKAATETQEQKLKSTLDGVAKGETEPNDKYADALAEINKKLQEQNDIEVQKLWEGQTSRMHWPTILVKNGYIPDKFRGEIIDSGRRYYTRVYPKVLQGVWERAEPVVADPPPPGLDVTWQQKVLLLPETIPMHYFDKNITPTNEEVWDAQEDIWLMELIFDGVARANRDATWIGEAPVRRIDQLLLTGGSGTSSVVSSGGGMGGMMDGMDMMGFGEESGGFGGMGVGGRGDDDEDMGGGGMGGGMGMGAMGMGAMARGNQGGVSFNVAEEFGMPVPKESEETEGGGDDMGYEEDPFSMDMNSFAGAGTGMMGMIGMMGGMTGMAGGVGGAMASQEFRYIGEPSEVEDAPFRERGFYMSVIVMLPDLPDFLAEMMSSDWPIRIGRFQIGPNPHYGQGSMGGYGGAGFGMRGGDMDDASGFGGMGGMMGGGGMGARRGGRAMGGRAGGIGGAGGLGGNAAGLANMLSGIDPSMFMGMGGGGMGGLTGLGGGLGRGGAGATGGSLPLPRTMQGPYEIDPHWFMHPDLVQVDFCGIITMYNPVKDDELEPTPDGSSEEETLQAIADQEVQLEEAQQAAEQAAAEQAQQAAGDAAPSDVEGAAPADTAAGPPDESDPATDDESAEQTPPAETAPAETNPE